MDFFQIKSIFDWFAIISFALSTWLSIRKIYFDGKPHLKIKANTAFFIYGRHVDNTNYLSIRIINDGFGDVHLTSFGFQMKEKDTMVITEGYFTNPLNEKFPYSLAERKRFEIFVPESIFLGVERKEAIKYFFVSDEMDKHWKLDVRKYIENIIARNEK